MNVNNTGLRTRWLRTSLLALAAALAVPAVAEALFVVTMVGTVEEGNLNGTDLSGELLIRPISMTSTQMWARSASMRRCSSSVTT